MEKIEKDIANTERRIERRAANLASTERSLNKARRDLNKHQAGLKSAKVRATITSGLPSTA